MAEETTLDELIQDTYEYFQANGTALDKNVILAPDDDAGWARIKIIALQDDGSQQICGILELAAILEKYGGDVLAAKQEVLEAIDTAKDTAVTAISSQQSASENAFDAHVAQKQTAFDSHVVDKQNEFDAWINEHYEGLVFVQTDYPPVIAADDDTQEEEET